MIHQAIEQPIQHMHHGTLGECYYQRHQRYPVHNDKKRVKFVKSKRVLQLVLDIYQIPT